MAYMMNCGTDWTYDLFMEDASLYKATPCKGVYCSSTASDRNQFMVWFKNLARDFKLKWFETHKSEFDRQDGWIGDAFSEVFKSGFFSDYYKDTYGQRPHLRSWYYIQAVDLPTADDVYMSFCNDVVADAVWTARWTRKNVIEI